MVLGEAVVAEYGQAILNRAKDDVVSLVDAVSLIKGGAYTKEADGTGRMVMRIKELNSGPRQIIVSPLGSHPTNGIPGARRTERTSLIMDSSLMLIEPFAAAAHMEALRAAEEASRAKAADTGGGASTTTVTTGGGGGTPRVEDSGKGGYPSGTGGAGQALKKQFYGSIELDPILAKKQFADLVDEVVQQFTMRTGVKVKIAIEIQAESATGFDDGLQRAVKENCNVLKFKNAEFESGD